ncbi:hypothetical protein ACJX0J_016868, partial [Zea mays]
ITSTSRRIEGIWPRNEASSGVAMLLKTAVGKYKKAKLAQSFNVFSYGSNIEDKSWKPFDFMLSDLLAIDVLDCAGVGSKSLPQHPLLVMPVRVWFCDTTASPTYDNGYLHVSWHYNGKNLKKIVILFPLQTTYFSNLG